MQARVEGLLGDYPQRETGFAAPAELDVGGRWRSRYDSDQAEVALGTRPSARPPRPVRARPHPVLLGGMSSRLYGGSSRAGGWPTGSRRSSRGTRRGSDLGAGRGERRQGRRRRYIGGAGATPDRRRAVPSDSSKGQELRAWPLRVPDRNTAGPAKVRAPARADRGRIAGAGRALAGLGAVTADDVHRVAAELFPPGRLRLALIGPFDDPARFERFLCTSGLAATQRASAA